MRKFSVEKSERNTKMDEEWEVCAGAAAAPELGGSGSAVGPRLNPGRREEKSRPLLLVLHGPGPAWVASSSSLDSSVRVLPVPFSPPIHYFRPTIP